MVQNRLWFQNLDMVNIHLITRFFVYPSVFEIAYNESFCSRSALSMPENDIRMDFSPEKCRKTFLGVFDDLPVVDNPFFMKTFVAAALDRWSGVSSEMIPDYVLIGLAKTSYEKRPLLREC